MSVSCNFEAPCCPQCCTKPLHRQATSPEGQPPATVTPTTVASANERLVGTVDDITTRVIELQEQMATLHKVCKRGGYTGTAWWVTLCMRT